MVKRVVLGLLAFCAAVVCAAPVDEAMAKKAIGHWRTRRGTLDTRMGRDVSEVRRVSVDGAEVHVIRFAGGGYAVAPTDTTVRPVILFSEDSDFEATPENPMWALVKGELAARTASAAPARRLLSAAVPATPSLSAAERRNVNDWDELLADAAPQYSEKIGPSGIQTVDNVRVAPLLGTTWAQQSVGGNYCYNYSTPNHYPCGCVATATAQAMRFFQWPTAEVGSFTNPRCKVGGVAQSLTTQGGTYDWSKMPLSPTASTPDDERQAIGKLTSDLGILLSMEYAPGGSGSQTFLVPEVLKLLGYSNACIQYFSGDGDLAANGRFRQGLISNLDAGLPVVLGIPGHSIVGDGYGYNGGTLYYHLNYGWNDSQTCWYSPSEGDLGYYTSVVPTTGVTETNRYGFTDLVYNIYTTRDGQNLIASGTVLDADGGYASGKTVTAVNASTGAQVASAETNEKGIYALFVPAGEYRLSVETPAEDAGNGIKTRLVGSLTTNVFAYVSGVTPVFDESGIPIKDVSTVNNWRSGVAGNVAQCDIALRSERFRTIANGDRLVNGTAYDCNVEVAAGATVSLDALPAAGGAAAVTAPGQTVTLKGNLTVKLPSGSNAPGTYTLFSAGAVVVVPGATITVTGPNAKRFTWEVTTTAQAISLTLTGNNTRVTADSYVQRSILAHWDAVDNQGTGSHDSTATTWKDRKNTDRAFTLLGTTWQNGKALKFAGNANSYGYLDASGSTYTSATFGRVYTKGVIEYVVNLTGQPQCVLKTSGELAFQTYQNGSYRSNFHNSGTTTYDVGLNGDATISVFYANALNGVYKNVASVTQGKCPTGGSDYISGTTNGKGTLIGKRHDSNFFKGSIYALRLYSEQLTVEELAINYAIDRVRFYGATADVSTLLPAGWDVGDDGLLCHRIQSGALAATTWTDYGAQFDAGATVTLSSLPAAGTSVLTVTGRKVALLGDLTFVLPDVGAAGTYTLVRADGITCPADANVTVVDPSGRFLIRNMTRTDGEITVELEIDTTSIMKATWTGAANDGNLQNPENWTCLNPNGETIPGIPQAHTVVTIPNGCTNNFPASSPLAVREVKLPATLGADVTNLDWSGITAPFSGMLDLKGKKLTVSQLSGSGAITDSTNAEYELLDSITSTGTQYIDTGVTAKPGLAADTVVAFLANAASDWPILGVKDAELFWMMGYRSGNRSINYYKNRYGLSTTGVQVFALDTDYHLEASAAKSEQTIKVNGELWSKTNLATPATTTNSMYFFTYNNNGNPGTRIKLRLSHLTISDGTGVLRNFVPVRRAEDGAVGLLDLANRGENEFYANKGTGVFTAGAVTNYIYKADATDTPGELHVEVAAGETRVNESVTLMGSLKLVKEGAGTFTAAKEGQSYRGGTMVDAGAFQVAAADESENLFVGAADGAITVGSGATLDVNGNPGFTTHPIVLAGGTLKNGAATTPVSVGAVTLTADSTIYAGGGITHTVNVVLGGKALAVTTMTGGNYYYRLAAGVSYTGPGSVARNISGAYFQFDGTDTRDMSDVDLKFGCAVNLSGDITVRNLESTYTGQAGTPGTAAAKFLVTGTYKPASSFHRGCEMQNGSTLDLSALTGPVSNVTFAADSTVTVSFGDRTDVKVGDRVVAWEPANKPDATVTFLTTGESWESKDLKPQDDGLYLSDPYVARATWTGADPTDVTNPANWQCTSVRGVTLVDKIPTGDTVVTLPDGCTNSFPVGGAFLAREVKLPAALGADNLDWRGITAPFSGTLDLKGKKLTVSQLAGDCEITDTSRKYELLDSITSTGTQYIDTGVIGKSGLTASADLAITVAGNTDHFILGARETTTVTGDFFCMLGYNKKTSSLVYYDSYSTGGTKSFEIGKTYHLEASAKDGKQTMSVEGDVWSSRSQKTLTQMTKSLYAFAYNRAGTAVGFAKIRLYEMTISDGDTVLRNFVPARQVSTGKVGLLDLANRGENEFYENKGTGTFTAGTVTNSIYGLGEGELHIEVASGALTNETVTLSGSLKLVKEGAGTFVAAKEGQSYVSGTEVTAGTFGVPAGDESVKGYVGLAGSAVTVDAGATLSLDATDFTTHPLVLAGGTLENASSAAVVTLGPVTLTADSAVTARYGITHGGDVELGGKALTVNGLDKSRKCTLSAGAVFTNGAVCVKKESGGGWFWLDGTAARDMSTVDLKIERALNISGDITVRDLELNYFGSMSGTGKINVCGTYKAGTYHPDCVMLDKSTLDLGAVTGAWSLKTSVTVGGKAAERTVTFEEGATIQVSLGGRKVKSEQIVAWQNDPGEKVTFVLEPGVNARLVRKSNGLWLQSGLVIRIR